MHSIQPARRIISVTMRQATGSKRFLPVWFEACYRSPLLFVAVLLVALVSLACSSDSTSAVASAVPDDRVAKSIQEVLIGNIRVEEITANSVSIRADTNIDLVCAVSFGRTSEYGSLATDTDMSAGGHDDHHPILTGLEPDTLYHYRLGGLGPDGTVFLSEDMTFTTPPADTASETPDTGINLALLGRDGMKVTDVSSNFGGAINSETWGANSAFDGDPTTAWSSAGDGDGAYIEIELDTETHITSIAFWTRTMGSSAEISTFRVLTDTGEVAGPFTLLDATRSYVFTTDLTARRLRFEAIETSGGNTGAVEIAVFGEPVR